MRAILLVAAALLAASPPGSATAQDGTTKSHGLALYGDLKYGPDFAHFDYANPQAPKEHKEISIDSKLFDRYLGRYQIVPAFVIAVTREGDHLYGQATGQPRFELFAEGEHDFFLKVTDAQVTFEVQGDGPAGALVLHQLGRDQRATRVE